MIILQLQHDGIKITKVKFLQQCCFGLFSKCTNFHFSSSQCHMSLAEYFDFISDGEKRSAFRKMNFTSVR